MTKTNEPKTPELKSLAITALYTAEVWRREKVAGAELLGTVDARRVYGATNAALGIARVFGWLSRLIRRERWSPLPVALAHRHALIDRWVMESDATTVLELAAGLSPRGLSESARSGRPYVEVDIPEMVEWKDQLLDRTEGGRDAKARPHWRRVGGDIRQVALESLVDRADRVLVVAEGLLMYLDATAQQGLFRRVAALTRERGGELIFDLVPPAEEPPAGILGLALGWLMRRFTKGAGFAAGRRSRQDVLRDLEAAGFTGAEAVEPASVARALALPRPETWSRQVVFRARMGSGKGIGAEAMQADGVVVGGP